MGGDEHHHTVTRDELMKPYEPSFVERHVVPGLAAIFDVPVTLFREHIIERVRKPYPYYHRRYKRVPTIESCELDDPVCLHEANIQFHRDRLVDTNILRILKRRRDECAMWHRYEAEDVERFCKNIINEHEEAAVNYFIKYGELSWNTDVRHAFMKQKHRMLWERRNGPVGTGERSVLNTQKAIAKADEIVQQKTDDMFSILRRTLGPRSLPKEMRP